MISINILIKCHLVALAITRYLINQLNTLGCSAYCTWNERVSVMDLQALERRGGGFVDNNQRIGIWRKADCAEQPTCRINLLIELSTTLETSAYLKCLETQILE